MGLAESDHILRIWERIVPADNLRYRRVRPVNILADAVQGLAEDSVVRGQSDSFDIDR